MKRTSKMALAALIAVGAVALSAAIPSPAGAGGGGGYASPTMKFMMDNDAHMGAETMGETRLQFACTAGLPCANQVETSPLHAEPGTFWHAISICDHLEGTGISCLYDPNYVDDNN